MPTISTCGKGIRFTYEGDLENGIVIKYPPGPSIKISSLFLKEAIAHLSGKEVEGGFLVDNPPPGGFGEWVENNSIKFNNNKLTPAHGSRIAAILEHMGCLRCRTDGRKVTLIFNGHSVSDDSKQIPTQHKEESVSGDKERAGAVEREKSSYDIFAHRHNFAVWAAARAVQRRWKGATTPVLIKAIEYCEVKEFIKLNKEHSISYDDFEQYHRLWCREIQKSIDTAITGATYGRAAKLLAVYLKAMVIAAGAENTNLGYLIHPPIDSILLKNIRECKTFQFTLTELKKLKWKWTKINESEYDSLMSLLRQCLSKEQPFWMLEEYWDPRREKD
ncbi:MAG: hypothetical protein ACLQVJ_27055 [Syntrophobacteraceae bacterium]